jgi:uncharacterized damage-inducible protein DinB
MKSEYFLEEREKETHEILDIVKSEFSTLSSDQLNTKPASDKWSISECLAHLNLTLKIYIPQMQKVVNEKENYGLQKENFSYSAIGKLAVKAMQPKADKSIGFKMKTFKRLNPKRSEIDAQAAIANFLDFQRITIEVIHGLKNTSLTKPKIVTTAGPILKMGIGDALHFMVAHNQRHIVQAQNVFKIIY